jgi:hypothetical protein
MGWLAAKAAELFEKEMPALAAEPWHVRDDYIRLILDRRRETVEGFVARHAARALDAAERIRFLKLLEMERQAMLIFTSDGWFFDDISNIETVQVVQYASRLMQLVRDVGGPDLEPEYVRLLGKAVSNVPEYKNGAKVYDLFIRPAFVDYLRLGAHYAVSSLFEEYPATVKIGHYSATADVCGRAEDGQRKLAFGRVTFTSAVTLEERPIAYAALYLGGQDLMAGVRDFDGEARFERTCRRLREGFGKRETAEVKWLIEQEFGARRYSLDDLFKDEKRKVLGWILDETLSGLEADYRKVFEANRAVMAGIRDMQVPLPEALAAPAAFVVNADLRRLLEQEETDIEGLRKAVDECRRWSFEPDKSALGFAASKKITTLMTKLAGAPEDAKLVRLVLDLFRTLEPLRLDLNLWKSQNIYFALGQKFCPGARERSCGGDAAATGWLAEFEALAGYLRVNATVTQIK